MSPQEAAPPQAAARWLAPLVVLLVATLVVYAGAVAWAGSTQTLSAIGSIGLATFLLGTLVSSTAYVARFGRWQAILQRLGHAVPVRFSARVYLAGIALSTTPAKLGETVRSVLLLPRGVPVRHTLAAFFADRLSDVIGVAALGAAAGAWAGARQPILEAITSIGFVTALASALVIRGRHGSALLARLGAGRRWIEILAAPAVAWATVWTGRRSLAFAAAAVVAFGAQGLVFGAYVQAVAPQVGLWLCVSIFAAGTLIGAASMIPGGLGAMEASLAWQLTQQGLGWPEALAAVLATRASTLWFGTLLGVLALASLAGTARGAPAR